MIVGQSGDVNDATNGNKKQTVVQTLLINLLSHGLACTSNVRCMCCADAVAGDPGPQALAAAPVNAAIEDRHQANAHNLASSENNVHIRTNDSVDGTTGGVAQ